MRAYWKLSVHAKVFLNIGVLTLTFISKHCYCTVADINHILCGKHIATELHVAKHTLYTYTSICSTSCVIYSKACQINIVICRSMLFVYLQTQDLIMLCNCVLSHRAIAMLECEAVSQLRPWAADHYKTPPTSYSQWVGTCGIKGREWGSECYKIHLNALRYIHYRIFQYMINLFYL